VSGPEGSCRTLQVSLSQMGVWDTIAPIWWSVRNQPSAEAGSRFGAHEAARGARRFLRDAGRPWYNHDALAARLVPLGIARAAIGSDILSDHDRLVMPIRSTS
jgi:hypothetical protein